MFRTLYARSWVALNLLWLAVACGSPAAAAARPDSAATALHVDGAKLKDATGKTILLRGINHHGFVDVPDGAWDVPGKPLFSGIGHWDPAVIKGALEEYRRLGFNVLRFHTVVEWWKENPRSYQDPWRSVTYSQPYRQMLKDPIQWAGERGLYVIFDFFAMKNTQGKQSGQETLPWPPPMAHICTVIPAVVDPAQFIAARTKLSTCGKRRTSGRGWNWRFSCTPFVR